MSIWKSNRLRQLRFDKRLPQHEVARRVGVSQATYWKWESAYAEPEPDDKRRLARVFRVPVDELVEVEDKAASA